MSNGGQTYKIKMNVTKWILFILGIAATVYANTLMLCYIGQHTFTQLTPHLWFIFMSFCAIMPLSVQVFLWYKLAYQWGLTTTNLKTKVIRPMFISSILLSLLFGVPCGAFIQVLVNTGEIEGISNFLLPFFIIGRFIALFMSMLIPMSLILGIGWLYLKVHGLADFEDSVI